MPELTLQDLRDAMPFAAELGIRLTSAEGARVVGELDHSPAMCTMGGAFHGGALMALADSVSAVCAFLNLPPGASTATIESGTHFFRAAREGTVTAQAVPRHVGRSTIVVRTELTDAQGHPVAEVLQTQAVRS